MEAKCVEHSTCLKGHVRVLFMDYQPKEPLIRVHSAIIIRFESRSHGYNLIKKLHFDLLLFCPIFGPILVVSFIF